MSAAAKRRTDREPVPCRFPHTSRRRGRDDGASAADGVDHRQQFVCSNLRLVSFYARRFRHTSASHEDLVQEGYLGLLRAVDRFDHTRGVKFSTYATWWILAAMHQLLAREGLKAPADHRLRLVSLDDFRSRDSDSAPWDDFIPDPNAACPAESAESSEIAVHLRRAVSGLRPVEADVLARRFGLSGGQGQTFEEIARIHGLSRERIRQIENEALAKLRKRLRWLRDERPLPRSRRRNEQTGIRGARS